MRSEKTGKDTDVHLNTDADPIAEAVIKLKGTLNLSKAWFVLLEKVASVAINPTGPVAADMRASGLLSRSATLSPARSPGS